MLGPLTILIADHDTQLYKEHYDSIDWTALGFEIKGVCKTGEAALTSAEIDQPDFLILDCHLPGQAVRSLAEMFLKISLLPVFCFYANCQISRSSTPVFSTNRCPVC